MFRSSLLALLAVLGAPWLDRAASGQEAEPGPDAPPVFSGPQVGEPLPPFLVRGAFDEDAGKELDFVARAQGRPIVLVFVHDVNRPSIAMTRALTQYTVGLAKDGLVTGVVWLDDDATGAEATLQRIRHALTPGAPTGISLDGKEGPGGYGLNREVTLTILIGHQGKVTANHALIQPSLQTDLPRVLRDVIAVNGGTMPDLATLTGAPRAMSRPDTREPSEAPDLRALLRPLIQKDATPEEVARAALAVESRIKDDEEARRELGRIARTVVESGKLENYGTATAQEYLRKWADAFGQAPVAEEEKPGDQP